MHRVVCRFALGSVLLLTWGTGAVWAKDTGGKAGVMNTTNSLAGVSTQPSTPPGAVSPVKKTGSRRKKKS